MPTVADIMSSPVLSIEAQESLRRAAEMLRELDVGALPVCQDGRLLGMVTDRDLAVRGVAAGLSPDDACVSDVMSTDLVTCEPDDDVQQAMDLMGREQLRRLPVVRDGQLMGIVVLADVAREGDEEDVAETVRSISRP
jgi:CBS domain-containing protein